MPIEVEGIEDLQERLDDFRLAWLAGTARAVRRLIAEAETVVKRNTPVRSGRTRRSITSRVSVRSGGIRGEVYSVGTEDYIAGVERRHRMFAHGQAFLNRQVRPRLTQALTDAVNQTFNQGGGAE